MPTERIVRVTYWGGWVSTVVAIFYKLLVANGVGVTFALQTQIVPHHFWQISVWLFLICIATVSVARAKGA